MIPSCNNTPTKLSFLASNTYKLPFYLKIIDDKLEKEFESHQKLFISDTIHHEMKRLTLRPLFNINMMPPRPLFSVNMMPPRPLLGVNIVHPTFNGGNNNNQQILGPCNYYGCQGH